VHVRALRVQTLGVVSALAGRPHIITGTEPFYLVYVF
jgi:hypothetical protein